MNYYFNKTTDYGFEEAIEKVTEQLKEEGFGVLFRINMDETLKNKIGAEMPRYTTLGACNPRFAWEALQADDHIGLMLPCNVIIRDVGNGRTEVSAIHALQSMLAVENEKVKAVAAQITEKLEKVIGSL